MVFEKLELHGPKVASLTVDEIDSLSSGSLSPDSRDLWRQGVAKESRVGADEEEKGGQCGFGGRK